MATETISKLALQRKLNVSPAKLDGAIRALSINSGINQFTEAQAAAIARHLQGQPSQGNEHNGSQMTPPPSIDGGALMSLDTQLVQEAANQGAALADRQMHAMASGYLQRKAHLTEVLFGHIRASSQDFTATVSPAHPKAGTGYSDPYAGYFISAAEMPQISGS